MYTNIYSHLDIVVGWESDFLHIQMHDNSEILLADALWAIPYSQLDRFLYPRKADVRISDLNEEYTGEL